MNVNPVSGHFRVSAAPPSGASDIVVCAASGELDACSAAALPAQLPEAMGEGHRCVVLDMAEVTLVSAAGARALTDLAATLAETGCRLLLARCDATVRNVMDLAGSPHSVTIHPSVADALSAYHAEPDERILAMPTQRLVLLRQQASNLPDPLRTRPLIAGAIDELCERYGLPDSDTAFTLLRGCSQRYNIKLRSLALAFLSAPPTTPQQPLWFGGRHRIPAPPVTFTAHHREPLDSRSGFLAEVLNSALSIMDSEAGYVQLADHFLGGLQLESQRGLPREFGQSLRHVSDTDSASGAAFASGRPTARELSRQLDPRTRKTLWQQGLRYVYSIPLRSEQYPEMGVVSTLHLVAPDRTTGEKSAELDEVSTQSATWLHWYQRTVMLDALEHLHNAARRIWLHRDR